MVSSPRWGDAAGRHDTEEEVTMTDYTGCDPVRTHSLRDRAPLRMAEAEAKLVAPTLNAVGTRAAAALRRAYTAG
jgi:hypothetical protein